MNVRVRFPPSPTGWCHVGTARMALINYLFARRHGGEIVFRSEDTDRSRSSKEYENDIIESFKWLGFSWKKFYRQSERTEVYRAALEGLVAAGAAYVSEEESKAAPGTVARVVRLRNPNKVVAFRDIVRGEISFDTTELKDFAIARALDDPLYHLSVVVDDAHMGVTHVIRGEEHISNTPRQILIQEALGCGRPIYAHYPLFLGADKSKLSKRRGDVAIREYRERGYLPEALVNFIGTLGWTPPSSREILSLEEMAGEFDLKDLHKSGAVFAVEKLRWYNRRYLAKLSGESFEAYAREAFEHAVASRGLPHDAGIAAKVLPVLRERISAREDIADLAGDGEFDFFFADPAIDAALIPEKKSNRNEALAHLRFARDALAHLPPASFADAGAIREALWNYATEQGRGAVLWPLRYALSGRERSPDPFVIASVIGKESSLRRLDAALSALENV